MAADRQRLAAALAYEEERRRRMMESVPTTDNLPPVRPARSDLRTNLENFSAGLGQAGINALEGTKALITDPVGTARATYEGVKGIVRDPSVLADALRYTAQKATSGPLGAGEVLGEFLTPSVKGVGKRDIFIGENARTWDAAAAKRAEEMEASGIDPETIWRETGTFRAPDNRLRQEISDEAAMYRPGAELARQVEENQNFSAILDDALYLRKQMERQGMIGINSMEKLNQAVDEAANWFRGTFGRDPQPESSGWAANKTPEEIAGRLKTVTESVPSRIKMATSIENVLEHPEFAAAYPGIARSAYYVADPMELGLGTRGVAGPKGVGLSQDIAFNLGEGKSVTLHEIQHKIQEREGFGKGGNPETARQYAEKPLNEELGLLRPTLEQRSRASAFATPASRAQYAQRLNELQRKENIKPRDLTRLSDWYQYGTRVSQEMSDKGFGWQVPKAKGPERDLWLRNATRIMQQMIEKDRPEMRGAAESMTPAQAKAALAKANKIFQKTQPEAMQASKIQDKLNEVGALSDYELYRRLAGEAEARLVQERMNLTPEQRRTTFPQYDVAPKQQIIRR